MTSFDVCGACRRHVKAHEPRCPFCGDGHVRARCGVGALPRMSRAALATVSSLLASACASDPGAGTELEASVDTPQPSDQGGVDDHTGLPFDTSIEASSETDGATDTVPPREDIDVGTLDTSACETETNAASPCIVDPNGFDCDGTQCSCYVDVSGTGALYCFAEAGYDITAECRRCLSCDCFKTWADCECVPTPDNCAVGSVHCGGCYGAPPARFRSVA